MLSSGNSWYRNSN